jgi:hypothetical protein
MSGKNRAFALAVATAALVGLSAPVAGAATFSGPNGFNNDSLLNVSGNQLPLQACNNEIPVNVLGVQVPLTAISAALGVLNSGALSSQANQSCAQTPSQSITSTTSTGNTTTITDKGKMMGSDDPSGGWAGGGNHNTSGFNNDSLVNLSNNQVPVQACNNDVPVNVLGVQVPVTGASGVLGLLNSGPLSSSADRTCTQTPSQMNGSSTTTGSTTTITNGG